MSIFSDSLLISFLLCDHHCGLLTSFIWQIPQIFLKYLLFFHVSVFLPLFSSYHHFNQPSFLALSPKNADIFGLSCPQRAVPQFYLTPALQHLFLPFTVLDCVLCCHQQSSSLLVSSWIPFVHSFADLPHYQKYLPGQNSLSYLESFLVCLFFTIVVQTDLFI